METAIITGVTGLVGSTLSVQLKKHGFRVIGLGRDKTKLQSLEQQGIETIQFDLTDPLEHYPMFPSDAIWYHCAAAISGSTESVLEEVNVLGTEKIIQAATTSKAKQFIQISSIATYKLSFTEPIKESSPLEPKSVYGKSKLKADELLTSKLLPFPFTIVKPPYIIGPGDKNFTYELVNRLRNRKLPIFTKSGTIGVIDARDLAELLYLLTQHPEINNRIVNVQGNQVNYEDLVQTIVRTCNLPSPKRYNYYFIIFVALINEVVSRLLGKNPDRGLSRYRIYTLTSYRSLNTTILDNQIQKLYISIRQSIEDWCVENKAQRGN